MSELRINFSVFESEILYNEVSYARDKHQYVDYLFRANPFEKNPKSPKLFITGLRFAEDNTPIFEFIQSPGDVPANIVINKTSYLSWSQTESMHFSNVPLYMVGCPGGVFSSDAKSTSDYMLFSFAEPIPGEETFTLIDSTHGEFTETEISNQQTKVRWSNNQFDPSMYPRLHQFSEYIEDGEYFIVAGGLIPTKYLPAEYFDSCVDTLLKEGVYLKRENAQETVASCFYITDDIWKFYPKEERWEMILPPTPLSYIKHEGGWLYSEFRKHLIFSTIIRGAKKIYFVGRLIPGDKPSTGIVYLFSLDYSSNKYQKVDEFDKISYKFNNYTKLHVGYDSSNDTMIFISNTLDAVIIVCLHTFNCIEIAFEAKFPPSYLKFRWRPIICENQGKLAIVNYTKFNKSNRPDNCRVQATDVVGLIEWESIKSQKIDPFLRKHRKKTAFQKLKSILV